MITLFGSKKGQIENYFAVVLVLFVLSISFIVSMLLIYNFVEGFNTAGVCDVGSACYTAGQGFIRGVAIFDKIVIIVVVVLLIAVGLTCYKLPTSAAFFIISFIMLPFLGYVSYFFNFSFAQIVGNAAFDAVRAFFPLTILVCTNFHWIAIVAWIIGSITLYAKKERQLVTIEQ